LEELKMSRRLWRGKGGTLVINAADAAVLDSPAVVQKLTKNIFERITVNISKPTTRKDTMEGQEYLVVPMVMITEGVHAGSNGPLYYPGEELSRMPVVWNHKPIVVYHPTESDGSATSACDPTIISRRKVGVIMNTTFSEGKLRAEAWINVERLRTVDSRILSSIEKGEPVEVSTGVFTDNEESSGTWGDKSYTHIARFYRPDHLALLPDREGACSVKDGAGLLMNEAPFPVNQAERGLVLTYRARFTGNEKSQMQTWDQLRAAVDAKFLPTPAQSVPVSPGMYPFVTDIFDTFVIYQLGQKFFKQGYEPAGTDVRLVGEPVEVNKETAYRTLDGVSVTNTRERIMEKKGLVDGLISNGTKAWAEADREYLMSLPEERLSAFGTLTTNQATPPAAPVQEPPKPKTLDELVANAPQEMREPLTAGLAAYKADRDRTIGTITANKANTFTVEQLNEKPMSELKAIAALAANARPADFSGQGDGAGAAGGEEPLGLPSTVSRE
jgi:hypothetical protein